MIQYQQQSFIDFFLIKNNLLRQYFENKRQYLNTN